MFTFSLPVLERKNSESMAEWSQLPRELLDLIAEHLQTEMDVLRFRSVCSSWRSVVTNPLRTPSRFPILPNEGISDTSSWGFYLSKRTIFRIGLPEQLHPQTSSSSSSSADGWLVKIEQDVPRRTHLLNPLSRSQFKPLPDTFPSSLDLLRYRVSELGHEYILQYINYRPFANSISDAGNLYMEKVALSSRPCSGSTTDAHVLLTIHVSGKLAMFKFRDRKWTIIDDLPSPYDDVILFHGQFYAVDNTGRTVLVNVDSSPVVNLVAHSVFGGDKKVLVESCGELLLIDTYLSVGPEDDLGSNEGFEFFEEFDCVMSERTVRFRVFRMDQREQKWVEVKSLDNQILFLGDNCAFSASASDFHECKGNCIIFTDHFVNLTGDEDNALKSRGVCVFDLESGNICPLANYPWYSKLFWPPPNWVSLTMLEVGLNEVDI